MADKLHRSFQRRLSPTNSPAKSATSHAFVIHDADRDLKKKNSHHVMPRIVQVNSHWGLHILLQDASTYVVQDLVMRSLLLILYYIIYIIWMSQFDKFFDQLCVKDLSIFRVQHVDCISLFTRYLL